jgi:uncharacterized protein (DUF2141 family)
MPPSLAIASASLIVALALSHDALARSLATLTVKVENVSDRGGNVRVALYDRASWPDDDAKPVIDGVVPAQTGETIVTLRGIPAGVYGMKAFQDYNRNEQFDTNFLGLPAEKYGFSNDARVVFSEPDFDAAKFTLSPGANTITTHLK